MWIISDGFIFKSDNFDYIVIESSRDNHVVKVQLKTPKDIILRCAYLSFKEAKEAMVDIYKQLNVEQTELNKQIDDLRQQILYLPCLSENYKRGESSFQEGSIQSVSAVTNATTPTNNVK